LFSGAALVGGAHGAEPMPRAGKSDVSDLSDLSDGAQDSAVMLPCAHVHIVHIVHAVHDMAPSLCLALCAPRHGTLRNAHGAGGAETE